MKEIIYHDATWIIIKNKSHQVLFLKRKSSWFWTIPWWKTEEWENSLKCAIRELREETGINNLELDFYTYTSSYTNGKHWKETTYIWYINNENDVKNMEKEIFDEIKFFDLNNLPNIDQIEKYDHDIIMMLKWEKKRNLNN